jgi:hypothetical protein
LAKVLGCTPALVSKIAKPCGRMKIPYKSEFVVYDAALAEALANDPRVLKSRTRRSRTDPTQRKQLAEERRGPGKLSNCGSRMATARNHSGQLLPQPSKSCGRQLKKNTWMRTYRLH